MNIYKNNCFKKDITLAKSDFEVIIPINSTLYLTMH